MEKVIERVLSAARQRLDEQLTLDDLAKMAMFSKFYFARMFRQVTGVSPRRFLYAMRLEEAKRLLVTTRLGVAAISFRVGYQGVGTFTSRFTASVGVSPTVYRRLGGMVSPQTWALPPDPSARCVIAGRVEPPEPERPAGPTLVGLFPGPVAEGRPAQCDLLRCQSDWSFQHVPPGRWYVLAVSSSGGGAGPAAPGRHPELFNVAGPVKVGLEQPTAHVTVQLRWIRPVDPPIPAGMVGPPALPGALAG